MKAERVLNLNPVSIVLTVLLSLAPFGHSQTCNQVFRPWGETATEIELDLNVDTIKLIQPKKEARTDWKSMRTMDKVHWLKDSARKETSDWYENKKFSEVETQDSFLEPHVEYLSATDREDLHAFEIHARTKSVPAGTHVRNTWDFLNKNNIARTHLHSHMTRLWENKPTDHLEPAKVKTAFALMDFWRRVNLVAESLAILHNHSIEKSFANRLETFGPLSDIKLMDAFRDFSYGQTDQMNGFYKIAFVGLRDSDTYDRRGVIGLEYRAIDKDFSPVMTEQLLNRIQEDFIFSKFQWTDAEIEAAYKAHTIPHSTFQGTLSQLLSGSWYHKDPSGLLRKKDSLVIVDLLTPENFQKITKTMDSSKGKQSSQLQLKMLLFDWRQDIFLQKALRNNPHEFYRIESLQRKYLELFLQDRLTALQATKHFIYESKLISLMYPGLNLDISHLKPTNVLNP